MNGFASVTVELLQTVFEFPTWCLSVLEHGWLKIMKLPACVVR